jgi:VanZ family protein
MSKPPMTTVARVISWLLLAAAAFLTLAPRTFRPYTGVEHHLEHFLAFALLGLLFGLGYPRRPVVLALIGVMAAAALEIGQRWVPGRHALLSDFVINAAGVCAGVVAAVALNWLVAMRKRNRAPSRS